VEGRSIPEGDPVEGYYEPIISTTTYHEVQRIISERSRGAKDLRGRVTATPNLFTRLIYCMYDGGRYHLQSKGYTRNGVKYEKKYLIPYDGRANVKGSMNLAISYDAFEKSFVHFVRELSIDDVFAPKGADEKRLLLTAKEGELVDIIANLKATKEKIKKAKNVDALLSLVEDLDGDRKALVREVADLKASISTSETRVYEDMRSHLDDPDARAKVASALRLLVDRIDLLPIHRRTERYNRCVYWLVVEVHFANGERRVYVTDDIGATQMRFGYGEAKKKEGIFIVGYSVKSRVQTRAALGQLIPQASDEWRPRLTKWLDERYPEGD